MSETKKSLIINAIIFVFISNLSMILISIIASNLFPDVILSLFPFYFRYLEYCSRYYCSADHKVTSIYIILSGIFLASSLFSHIFYIYKSRKNFFEIKGAPQIGRFDKKKSIIIIILSFIIFFIFPIFIAKFNFEKISKYSVSVNSYKFTIMMIASSAFIYLFSFSYKISFFVKSDNGKGS